MTDFSDLLLPETVIADLSVASKKAVLQHLAVAAAAVHRLDAKSIAELLAQREKLGSTGFGGGVAIPHCKVPGLPKVVGVLARLSQGIDFQAIDDLPVDIVFLLLSPEDGGAEHLKALARVSRRLRDQNFVAKLRGAASPDALFALMTGEDARDAA